MTHIWHLARETYQSWQEDDIGLIAAALAYFSIFSLAPMLVIVIRLVGLVYSPSMIQGQISQQFAQLLGEDTASLVRNMIESISQTGGGTVATLVSLGVILFGATNLFFFLERGLNAIWDVPEDHQPEGGILVFVRRRLIAFGFVLVLGLLLLVSLVLNAVLAAFVRYLSAQVPGTGWLVQLVNILVTVVVTSVLFALIYKVMPNAPVSWRDVAVGSIVTAVLFTFGQLAIGFYLGTGSVTNAYGAAGSLAALLVWVFYSMQILLIGAEFTQVYSRYQRGKSHEDND